MEKKLDELRNSKKFQHQKLFKEILFSFYKKRNPSAKSPFYSLTRTNHIKMITQTSATQAKKPHNSSEPEIKTLSPLKKIHPFKK